jgi:hypothetical protein
MPTIDLSGPNGNAFALMATARTWSKQLGKEWQPILKDMQSGNYHHLLDVMDREFPHLIDWENDPREGVDDDWSDDDDEEEDSLS